MEENRNLELGSVQEEEKSAIDFQLIYSTLILNWKWFVLSIIVCLGLGYLYLKCAKPVFQTTTKVLIKDDQQNKRGNGMNSMIQNATNLGFMTNSNGIDNEIEIRAPQALRALTSRTSSTRPLCWLHAAAARPLRWRTSKRLP